MATNQEKQTTRRARRGTNLYLSEDVVAQTKQCLGAGESISTVTESLLKKFIQRRSK